MYIILKDNIPDQLVLVICAHASLACYKKFENNEDMIKWMNGIFKKVVCMVDEIDFDKYKNEADSDAVQAAVKRILKR
ncbi:peptidyl-tRNA hydrolase [Kaistella sp.]|uniref:peptidyl-tRNA hydrolase n=1 Tax=Kaistella sp. TaxID=2782235 RepID=UPI003C3B3ACE